METTAALSLFLRHLHALEDGLRCYDQRTGVYWPEHELYDAAGNEDQDGGRCCLRYGADCH